MSNLPKAIKPFKFKDILDQLKADLIGKDSHRGVSLTYSWLANQFGHISLGIIPTLIVNWFMKKCFEQDEPLTAAMVVCVMWLLFELYNLLMPLLTGRRSDSKIFNLFSSVPHVFKPKWGNLVFDTFTDLCFFWIGALVTGLLLVCQTLDCFLHHWSFTAGIVLLAILLILLGNYWFVLKMYQNYAYYPFQFRLSQWQYDLGHDNKLKVEGFVKNKGSEGKHLLLFGPKESGKTSLGVGMANELSIRKKTCTYTTGIKLYSMFFEDRPKEPLKYYWSWYDAEVLVIDDINPGEPISEELVTPKDFLKYVDREGAISNKLNRKTLKDKSVIWILGNETFMLHNAWENMLINDLEISEENIDTVNLAQFFTKYGSHVQN